MHGFNFFAILLGLSLIHPDVAPANVESIDWKAEIEKKDAVFLMELKTRQFHSLNQKLWALDFVAIMPDSVVLQDFEAIEKWDEEHFKRDHYLKGPAHIVSTCGNTALLWRTHSFKDDQGVKRNGTFLALYVYQDGTAKIKLSQSTV